MLTIPFEAKTFIITNLKYKIFELKTVPEFKKDEYVLKKNDTFSGEKAKYLLYTYLLAKHLNTFISQKEQTLLMVLYSDLCVSRHYLVPQNNQFINALNLTLPKENVPVIEITFLNLKILSSKSIECTIKIHLNVVALNDINNVASLDFVLYNNTLMIKDSMHLLKKTVKKFFMCVP